MKSKKSFVTILILAVAAVIGSLVGKSIFNPAPEFDEQLMKVANELNKNCPFMVDRDTRLDNALGGPGKTFTYNYTLINFTKDKIDLDFFINKMRPQILSYLRTNPSMDTFRENDVLMNYTYKDNRGEFLCNIEIKPEEYKN